MKIIEINNKSYLECDIILIDTSKKAKINDLFLFMNKLEIAECPEPNGNKYHLYITSNKEIKKDDYVYHKTFGLGKIIIENNEECFQSIPKHSNDGSIITPWKRNIPDIKKVIATTDSSLKISFQYDSDTILNNPLPQIPKNFIEIFIESYNQENVISKVLVEVNIMNKGYDKFENYPYQECTILKLNQKNEISILTEENSVLENAKLVLRNHILSNKEQVAKDLQEMREKSNNIKQETLEEAAELKRKEKYTDGSISIWAKNDWQACYKEGFIDGAKWQAERSYSREEIVQLLYKHTEDMFKSKMDLESWIKENLK